MGNGHTDHTGCMCNRKLSPQDYTMESLFRSVTPHLSTCMVLRPSMTTAILYVSVDGLQADQLSMGNHGYHRWSGLATSGPCVFQAYS